MTYVAPCAGNTRNMMNLSNKCSTMERRGQGGFRFPKPKVTGSSPVGTANNINHLYILTEWI
jgi:hypothetical protein